MTTPLCAFLQMAQYVAVGKALFPNFSGATVTSISIVHNSIYR
jgi:hypothetical protein